MKTIFLDESGDLGFSEKSSKYLVITLLICDIRSELDVSRIIKKVRTKILKKKLKTSPEIKWNNSKRDIKEKVLSRVSKLNVEIHAIIIPKQKVYDSLKEKKNKLYNYTVNLILAECSLSDSNCVLIVDKFYRGKFLTSDFNNYIKGKFAVSNCNSKLEIQHKDSRTEGGLQVVDFISGAVFNKYEYKNEEFYNLIKSKIVTEKRMFNMDPRG